MEILTLIISCVALLVSVATLYAVRRMSKDPAGTPDVGTLGAGGGGRR